MKNILFATLVDINSLDERGIYQDLMRELTNLGHKVYIISPLERRNGKKTTLIQTDTGAILKVAIGDIQKTSSIKKGISTLRLERQYVSAVKKYFGDIKFDLMIYSTPPITLAKVISFIKKRDGATTYLLLKDIFPQNAVDLGLLTKFGSLYRFFRKKERRLYESSDYIGCMSQANVDYLLAHNREIRPEQVHVCPNSITPAEQNVKQYRAGIRQTYGLPQDKKIFIYGGNLGKPQAVDFIVLCLKLNADKDDRFFLICGDGTQAGVLSAYIDEAAPANVRLMEMLPKAEYDRIVCACDVGMIFLDHRFTIPNFPSRLLSYMDQAVPVLACTDAYTDVGKTIVDNDFGWWCISDNAKYFLQVIDDICKSDDELVEKGLAARKFLEENYKASDAAKVILDNVG